MFEVRSLLSLVVATALVAVAGPARAENRLLIVPVGDKTVSVAKLEINKISHGLNDVTILPYAQALRSAKKMGMRATDLHKVNPVTSVGKALGANYVLIIQAVHGGHKHKTGHAVHVDLVNIADGSVAYSHVYPLIGKRVTPALAGKVAEDVRGRLAPPPEPESDVDAVADAPPPPPKPAPTTAQARKSHMEVPAPPTTAEDRSAPAASSEDDAAVETDAEVKAAQSVNDSEAQSILSVSAGAMPFYRGAAITPAGGGVGPCFCVQPASSSPLLVRGSGRLEFYPGAIGRHTDGWANLGLNGEVDLGIPRTGTGPSPVTAGSNMFVVGATYRFVLGNGPTASNIKLRLGYSNYIFNVVGLQFPSLSIRGPYAAVGATIPLGTEHVALVLEARGIAPASAVVVNNSFGTQNGAAYGIHGEAGLRFTVGAIDVQALALMDNYGAQFNGNTTLPFTTTQYSNVSLADRSFGALLSLGFHL